MLYQCLGTDDDMQNFLFYIHFVEAQSFSLGENKEIIDLHKEHFVCKNLKRKIFQFEVDFENFTFN